jgi:bacterioferritin
MSVRSEVALNLAGVCQGMVTSLAQLRTHRCMVKHWGYEKLERQLHQVFDTRSEELNKLLAAILKSEGSPDLQGINRLNIGQTVEEILQSESRMSADLKEMVQSVFAQLPIADALLFQCLQEFLHNLSHQKHLFEQNLELIRQMGAQNFLASRC